MTQVLQQIACTFKGLFNQLKVNSPSDKAKRDDENKSLTLIAMPSYKKWKEEEHIKRSASKFCLSSFPFTCDF